MAKPPHTRAEMRAFYPVCQVAELAAGYRDTTRSRAYASPALFRRLSQGSLPTWAGSPLVGRDLHPLDDTQSFMKASPPPIPFDQQSLVALNYLSIVTRDE